MRALATLEDRQVEALDTLARERGTSRAALVRGSIDGYLAIGDDAVIRNARGLWERLGKDVDGVTYQRDIRAEWDHRP